MPKVRANLPQSHLDLFTTPGVLELAALAGGPELDAERRHVLVDELRSHLADNSFVLIDWAVSDIILRNSWKIESGSLEQRELARHLMRAWISALETSFKRDRVVYEDAQVLPIPSRSLPEPKDERNAMPKNGESLRHNLDAYLREQKQHVKANTKQDARAVC